MSLAGSQRRACRVCGGLKAATARFFKRRYGRLARICRVCESRETAKRAKAKHAVDWVARMLAYAGGHDRKSPSYERCNLDREHIEWLYEFQDRRCGWTGVPLAINEFGTLEAVSLDRVSGSRGCVKFNVMLTCLGANLARNNSTAEEMQEFVRRVKGARSAPHAWVRSLGRPET